MKKLVLQGFVLLVLFVGVWFGLSQINWMKLFKINTVIEEVPEKLGEMYWKFFQEHQVEVLDSTIVQPIDSLIKHICTSNGIDPTKIKLHILSVNEINAFSLPDRHLVIYTGLLNATKTEDQLCGVISHEIAHMERNHVMKKLIREIGLSTLLSSTTGGYNGEFILESAKILTSTAYDREWENEADLKAVQYLQNAHINVKGLSQILEVIAASDSDPSHSLTWLSSHPDTWERIRLIQKLGNGKNKNLTPILTDITWNKMKSSLNE